MNGYVYFVKKNIFKDRFSSGNLFLTSSGNFVFSMVLLVSLFDQQERKDKSKEDIGLKEMSS